MQEDGALREGQEDSVQREQPEPAPVRLVEGGEPGEAEASTSVPQIAAEAGVSAPNKPSVSAGGNRNETGRTPACSDGSETQTPEDGSLATQTPDPAAAVARRAIRKDREQAPGTSQDPDQPDSRSRNRTGADPRRAGGGTGDGGENAARLRRLTKNSWWRATFGDNFSLEYELDAKIDRLEILLAALPEAVVPTISAELRAELRNQLQSTRRMLAECAPFERAMQRINSVEVEIMMWLADDRIGLALEALRAEASISLPEPASKVMLEEIDRIAASEDAASRKVKLVGLKERLGASIIELFRGGERTRDATQFLGAALIVLMFFVGWLFYHHNELSRALFTHYGTPVTLVASNTGDVATATGPVADVGQPSNESQVADQTELDPALAVPPATDPVEAPTATLSNQVQALPIGEAPLIGLAFPVVLMAAAFGGIGACLSGLFSFTLQGRVPNEYEGWFRTAIRPTIGIASGFLAVFILRGGLFTFGDDLAWIAIVALIFGFSERLFMGTMARLEGLPR